MPPVPESLAALLSVFALAFTRPTFEHAQVLVTGTLLASGRRAVSAALRAVGLGEERHFTTYHRVLNRAAWSPLRLSRILLHLLSTAFLAPDAPLVPPDRWHARTALGSQDRPQRALARCGAFDVGSRRHDRGHPLGVPLAARPQPVGRARVGAARSDRPYPLASAEPEAGQAPPDYSA